MKQLSEHDRVKELLDYCPNLGLFWWKPRPTTTTGNKGFNTRFAGKIAGSRTSDGYGTILVEGKPQKAHRLAWFYMTGAWPNDEIDHANGRKLDNAFENLREATRSQNSANRACYSASGFRGVRATASGKFIAELKHNSTRYHLGTFEDASVAAEAVATRRKQLHGEYARD